MKALALDLWHDLREKRLWPVALVLLAGLVAVPVLLAKPVEDPGPPPAVSSAASVHEKEKGGQLARVTLEDGEAAGSGSTLGVFDPSDPFKPPKKVREAAREDPGSGSQAGPGDQATDDGGSGSGSSPSGGGTSDNGFAIIVPPTGGDPTPPSGSGEPVPVAYKYVVDVTFTANGRARRIKGMEKHDMLPGQASPLLISMGVTDDGGNAVFLVDATLEGAGEGRCKPSGRECELAYIGPGSEHVFTQDDGDTYTVRVDEIRKVEAKPGAKGAKASRAEVARVVAGDKLEDSRE
jgi:hypothetical protein